MSLKACNKQADDKKLEGKDRAQFVRECRSKTAPVTSAPRASSSPASSSPPSSSAPQR
jgi:hypothetical protein